MTPHNQATLGEIAKTVIMPGDPLRAKYIAEHFLEKAVLVNEVRGIYAYTGQYHKVPVTIMASGMGNPSMGIYSYELYQFYGVENIIRIGTAGSYKKEIGLKDVVLAEKSYSKSSYAKVQSGYDKEEIVASRYLNSLIQRVAQEKGILLHKGTILCSDVFYSKNTSYEATTQHDCLAIEMESFALFANAQLLGKNAACLLTISDSMVEEEQRKLTPEERQTSLNTMITLALDTVASM